jgi:NIMA (never in mitosis gene a)-related kinase
MEYAEGGDLYHKIKQHKKQNSHIDEQQAWRYIIQMVKGLKVLHDLSIFHRDLKSANVFLTGNN